MMGTGGSNDGDGGAAMMGTAMMGMRGSNDGDGGTRMGMGGQQ